MSDISPFAKQLFDREVARMEKDAAIVKARKIDYEGRQLNYEAFVDDREQRDRDIEDRSEP